jgi:phage terminase large subunit-like protein
VSGLARKVDERGAEAEMLLAPLSSTLRNIELAKASIATNADRLKNVKLEPKLTNVVEGQFDWLEFYVFLVKILGYEDMRPQPHDEICQFIASLFPDLSFKTKGQHFGQIMVPRNCFKTVIFSVGLPLYLLWKNPNGRGVLSAHRHDAAKKYLTTIKWHIENNQDFIALCGNWRPKGKEIKWAEDAIILLTREKAYVDPSIDTAGVDRSKVGAHPDWVICDDLHSEKNIESALMRNKVYDHIVTFYPMLQPGGTMIVVGTRWHMQDAYGKLLFEDAEAVANGHEPQFNHLIRSAYIDGAAPGQPKKLYFPERLTESFLDKARRLYKAKFSLWFLNQAIADSDKLFPKEELDPCTMDFLFDDGMGLPTITLSGQLEPIPVSTTLAWDPAGVNPTDKSDFHGISIVCCDPLERLLIPKAEAIKARPDEVLKRVTGYIIMYEPEAVIIEDNGQSGVWGYMLRQHLEQQGLHCPPITFFKPPTRSDKHTRISSRLQPKWANKQILIDRRNRELIDQFDNFPQLDYDDLIDSVQMHLDYIHSPITQEQYLLDAAWIITAPKPVNKDIRVKAGAFAGAFSSKWGNKVAKDHDLW